MKLALIKEAINASHQQTVIKSLVCGLKLVNNYMRVSDIEETLLIFGRDWRPSAALCYGTCVCALSPGSVPLEQLFSTAATAGLILNGKRSQLSPFQMNKICFCTWQLQTCVNGTAGKHFFCESSGNFHSVLYYQKWNCLCTCVVSKAKSYECDDQYKLLHV